MKLEREVAEGWGAKSVSALGSALLIRQHSSKPPLRLTAAQNLHAGSFMAGFHGLAAPLGVICRWPNEDKA